MKKMMLKVSMICLLGMIFLDNTLAQAQDNILEDTYWRLEAAVRPGNSIIAYFRNDTMYVADDLEDEFDELDIYQVKGDTFFLQRLYSAGDCDRALVGQYKLVVTGETMRFTLIEEECEDRITSNTDVVYTSLAYTPPTDTSSHINNFSIAESDGVNGLFLYQNNSLLKEKPEYRVYDVLGHEIERGKLFSEGQIRLVDEEDGTYFISILWQFGTETFQLFKLSTTSILEPNTPASYTIFPNPSPTGIFTYENQEDNFQTPYRIYSMTGQLLQVGELGTSGEIDISRVASGMYFLILQGSSQTEVLKLVK